MKKVVILQYRLLHYRTPLFEQLRTKCLLSGIDLHLVHGQPTRRELPKKDVGHITWADKITNYVWEVGSTDWLWQPLPNYVRDADIIIVMQESRLIYYYLVVYGLNVKLPIGGMVLISRVINQMVLKRSGKDF